MSKTTLPCLDVPGNVFVLDVYKPQGRPAYAVATEGRITKSSGYECFSTELFGKDRRHTVPLGGNNTPKNRERALATLLETLVTNGWVSREDADNTTNRD